MIEIFIAFAAFVLVFYQFIRPIHYFRLNLGIVTQEGLLWILTITCIMAVVEIVLRYFPSLKIFILHDYCYQTLIKPAKASFFLVNIAPLSFIQYYYIFSKVLLVFLSDYAYKLIFYKLICVLWYSIIAVLPVYLLWQSLKPSKFSHRCAERYFDLSHDIISRGVQEEIGSLTNELVRNNNIQRIFEAAARDGGGCSTNFAQALLKLFSDEIFCKNIVNHNPKALYSIFDAVINNSDFHNPLPLSRSLVNWLIYYMFTQTGSILYREEPYRGLGHFSSIKQLVFSRVSFLVSEYKPLSQWFFVRSKKLNNVFIEKYFEIIQLSLSCYLKQEKNDRYPKVIWAALNNIVYIVKKNNDILKRYSREDVEFREACDNLDSCSSGLTSLIGHIKGEEDLFPPAQSINDTNGYSFFKNDITIYGALAKGIYDIVEAFASNDHNNDIIRLLMLEINSEDDSLVMLAICERLNIYFKKKLWKI